MSNKRLQKELEKAKQIFSQWPEWKQTVLRDSMRGKVLTPRVVTPKAAQCDVVETKKQPKK